MGAAVEKLSLQKHAVKRMAVVRPVALQRLIGGVLRFALFLRFYFRKSRAQPTNKKSIDRVKSSRHNRGDK